MKKTTGEVVPAGGSRPCGFFVPDGATTITITGTGTTGTAGRTCIVFEVSRERENVQLHEEGHGEGRQGEEEEGEEGTEGCQEKRSREYVC
ncbi:hypothetical protein HZH66_004891 [Vespula vulgaris]|uniref:Uncharacterized protein n=1 Tax=Vespula vulgaris TaxID=7454 RepID=A0A834K8W7_VESVU|nr:hypothetical protein HZH66_004891 [Vespula vulgaris]